MFLSNNPLLGDINSSNLSCFSGKRLQNNVLAVHCDQELVGYASLLIGFGVWGDLMYNADKSRRWKKLRYLCEFISA